MIDNKNEIFVMFVRIFYNKKIDLNKIHIERRIQINSILIKKNSKYQNHYIRYFEKIRKNH